MGLRSPIEETLNGTLARRFADQLRSDDSPDVFQFLEENASRDVKEQLEVLLYDQYQKAQDGVAFATEAYLEKCPAVAATESLKSALIEHEFLLHMRYGQPPTNEEFLGRFPEMRETLEPKLEQIQREEQQSRSLHSTHTFRKPTTDTDDGRSSPSSFDRGFQANLPERFGRYRVKKLLGRGAFGDVYLARDEDLGRQVAIKVPHRDRISRPEDIEAYLAEGRILASLDHPHIVPVFDVGRTDDGSCYVVSKFIDGTDFAGVLERGELSHEQVAEKLAALATGLDYAHTRGLVHRDIKPANLLMDHDGRPYIADFGLALHEDEQRRRAGEVSGTPAYMAPEQISGKAHQLDGRADIWSVGVVLYELLTGRRPFAGDTTSDMFDEIEHREPKPPRQIDPAIPKELERICLQCLAKPVASRYTTAADLAKDLRRWNRSSLPMGWLVGGVASAVALIAITVVLVIALRPAAEPEAADPNLEEDQREVAEALAKIQGLLDKPSSAAVGDAESLPDDTPAISFDKIDWPEPMLPLKDQIDAARGQSNEDNEFSLLMDASNQLIDLGQFAGAEAVGERMVELARENMSRQPFAYSQLGLAQYRGDKGTSAVANFEKAIRTFETLYSAVKRQPDSPQIRETAAHVAKLLAMNHMRQGNAYKTVLQYDDASAAYDKAKQLYEQHSLEAELVTLLMNYGNLESQRDGFGKAIVLHQQAADLARKLGDPIAESQMLLNLGNAQSRADDRKGALKNYRQAHEQLPANASYDLHTVLLIQLSLALIDGGQMDEAKKRVEELRQIAHPEDVQSQEILHLFSSALNSVSGKDEDK